MKAKYLQIRIVFFGIIASKDKNDIHKKLDDTNNRLKKYCSQKNLSYIDNTNIKEEHLGMELLHLNKQGYSAFAYKLLNSLRLSRWHDGNFNFLRELKIECNSNARLDTSTFRENIEFTIIKVIRSKNLNWIILGHLNINFLRNKFGILANQIKKRINVLVISETKLELHFKMVNFRLLFTFLLFVEIEIRIRICVRISLTVWIMLWNNIV